MAVLTFAATTVAACGGDSLSERASPDEQAACARLEDIDRDRQLSDERKFRTHLQSAVDHADRSGNGELERLLRRVDDDFAWLDARGKADKESQTVIMRMGANLTLAEVECRERGVFVNDF